MEIRGNDKSALTVILREDNGLFVSTTGGPDDIVELLDRYAVYLEMVATKAEGKSQERRMTMKFYSRRLEDDV